MDVALNRLNFPKLDILIKDSIEKMATDWPKIIGQGANLSFNGYNYASYQDFNPSEKDLTILLEYDVSGKYSGKFYVKFAYRDAILIAGTLLLEEEDDINKSIATHKINDVYKDAFDEFANQTSASFNDIFKSHISDDDVSIRFSKSYHLVIDLENLKKILFQSKDDEIFIAKTTCSVWHYDKGDIDIIFPAEVAESFFNETIRASQKKGAINILIVDDSLANISFIKRCLRNTKYNVNVCNDAESSILKLRKIKMSAVFIAVYFEGREDEGLRLCQRIKKNLLLDYMPVILSAPRPTRELVLSAIKHGAADFLVMPFEKRHLIEKLEKHALNNSNR